VLLPAGGCTQQERATLTEHHPHLLPSNVTALASQERSLAANEPLWKHSFSNAGAGGSAIPSNPPQGTFLRFEFDGRPATWTSGTFVTPLAYNCSAEAREDLALTYGPGARYAVPTNGKSDRAFSLYGRPSKVNRTWAAYGSMGGGWEALWPDTFQLTNPQALCGSHASPIDYDGYVGGHVPTLGPLAAHLAAWLEAGGNTGGSPWMTPLGRRVLEEDAQFTPDRAVDRDPIGAPPATLRFTAKEAAAAAWEKNGWMWCVSVAKWRGAREGFSFWATAWADTTDGYRYVIGPLRPLDLKVENDIAETDRTRFWWRFSMSVWTLAKLLDSPAPGIRRFPTPA
jgi:hypothetical protein